ncbi:MAG: phosphatidylinositol kinase [Firmicutes bacterium]|nr:phosphatidylinositol kinase [Bacillota bacterium]
MPEALEHIRRMRGGAQAHLMRCSDGGYYVVKFQNNPQHQRILVNELLGTRLAARLGLRTPRVAVVHVDQRLIDLTSELVMQIGTARIPCRAGFQFGSRYPGDPAQIVVHDLLPEEQLLAVENLADFCGILVFDKWTCNTNGRQAIFYREDGQPHYAAMMIDQGFCFNAGEWNFPDAPLRGLYLRQRVYEQVRGMEAFEPWLARLEQVNERVLDALSKEIPPEWYDGDQDALYRLLEQLLRRRKRVPDLILEAKKSDRQPFPNWT